MMWSQPKITAKASLLNRPVKNSTVMEKIFQDHMDQQKFLIYI